MEKVLFIPEAFPDNSESQAQIKNIARVLNLSRDREAIIDAFISDILNDATLKFNVISLLIQDKVEDLNELAYAFFVLGAMNGIKHRTPKGNFSSLWDELRNVNNH